jgi:uncharacterized membrane protein
MLKKISFIIIATLAAWAISFKEFYFLKDIPTHLAALLHNSLASAVGIGFIIASELLKNRNKKRDGYSNALLAIGVALLAIHLIKIVLGKCA